MWMMGCSDGSGLNTSDSFNSRKLRPLIPRPTSSSPSSTTSTTSTTSSPTLSRIHAHDLLSLNTHLGAIEQGKRELITQPVSSRWNPTPEQLRTLEDLYRRGTRTPTAEQIQYITAQLRRYGKIEGKNVFYWFQNHKARERQKRKRRIEVAAAAAEHDAESGERKDSVEMSMKGFEAEGWKSWDSPTTCGTIVEESAPMGRPHSRRDAWLPCSEEFQIQSSADWHATWQMVHLSSLPHLLNTCSTIQLSDTTTITTTAASTADTNNIIVNEDSDLDNQSGSSRTLQLFPPRSDEIDVGEKGPTPMPTTAATDLGSYQFFQFLPLKN